MKNIDDVTVQGFGDEWAQFDQRDLSAAELREIFESYFSIFPWSELPANAAGFDLGCGSGRWAAQVASRVGTLHCVDASEQALSVARRNLSDYPNVQFHLASVDALPFQNDSMDFGYSLGVLHHIPDTASGLRDCVRKLRPGAPFLLYLYYAFDNRPAWFRGVWQLSEGVRRAVSSMPWGAKYAVSQTLAATVYWPLARTARFLERRGIDVGHVPLSAYRNRSFYVMRNDALDRFGTRLEQRFTRDEIAQMMAAAGLVRIRFSDKPPFWCAVGIKQ